MATWNYDAGDVDTTFTFNGSTYTGRQLDNGQVVFDTDYVEHVGFDASMINNMAKQLYNKLVSEHGEEAVQAAGLPSPPTIDHTTHLLSNNHNDTSTFPGTKSTTGTEQLVHNNYTYKCRVDGQRQTVYDVKSTSTDHGIPRLLTRMNNLMYGLPAAASIQITRVEMLNYEDMTFVNDPVEIVTQPIHRYQNAWSKLKSGEERFVLLESGPGLGDTPAGGQYLSPLNDNRADGEEIPWGYENTYASYRLVLGEPQPTSFNDNELDPCLWLWGWDSTDEVLLMGHKDWGEITVRRYFD